MSGIQVCDRPALATHVPLPIDPRIAARWVSVRRDLRRRRRRWAVAALVVITAVVGVWLLVHSPVLAVRHVVVRGIGHTDRASVVSAAGVAHQPMLDVDAGSVRRRLQALPWVDKVTVRRHWPATVTVDIIERTPAAEIRRSAGQTAIVDAAGRVLAVGPDADRILGAARPPLARLEGEPPAGLPGTTLDPAAQGSLAVLRALRESTPRQGLGATPFTLTSVSRSRDGTVTAMLSPGPIALVLGTTDELAAKLAAVRSVLAQLSPAASSGPATIDVRVPAVPVLTDGKKSSSVSTT